MRSAYNMLLIPSIVLAATASLARSAAAASLKIQIPPSGILANPNTLPASTHATLTSGQGPLIQAPLRRGNVIEFQDLPATGSYLLDIFAHDYAFAPYRVDIAADNTISGIYETYRGTQWSDRGVQLVAEPTSAATIQAKVLSKKSFYEERQGFNPMSLLKNPMILFGIAALAMTFGMPKLMENMDPEMKAEFEEMQKTSAVGGIMGAMQGQSSGGGAANFDLASYMAGAQQNAGGQTTKISGIDVAAKDIRERRK
jgi:ER membrane protein complex subunit 7